MHILHLSLNNKFINVGYTIFENAFPGSNTVWLHEIESLKSGFKAGFRFESLSTLDLFSPWCAAKLQEYDLVVIHALTPHWLNMIRSAPAHVKFLWLGWGYDYMEFLFDKQDDLLLPQSRALKQACHSTPTIIQRIKASVKRILGSDDKVPAIARVAAFNTVLESEYAQIVSSGRLPVVPPYVSWNYGTLEDTIIKDCAGLRVTGDNILLGNSADLRNNFLEAFDLLARVEDLGGRKVISPMSYAQDSSLRDIIAAGQERLGNHYVPLTDFLPLSSYIDTVQSCGFVVMNHVRQQGLGTIVQMMHMGARVFLREENPCYSFFKNEGAVINSIQQLEQDAGLLKIRLTKDEVLRNIGIIQRHWSRSVIEQKTKEMVAFVLQS